MSKARLLDKVYFVPVRRSPFKSKGPEAPAQDRLAMLKAALKGKPYLKISDCELRRPSPSYTIQTVRYFRKKFPKAQFFLLMGQDAMRHFGKWKNAREIRTECGLLSHKRFSGISSSAIRARVRAGKSLKGLVAKSVEAYIRRKGLYQA